MFALDCRYETHWQKEPGVAMSEAAPQAAEGKSSEDTEKALGLLQLLWGDEYTFGCDPEHGWWVIKDGKTGFILTASSAEELGKKLEDESGEAR
jgi:hypothetical protein